MSRQEPRSAAQESAPPAHDRDLRIVDGTGMSPQALASVFAGHDRALADGKGVLKRGRRTRVTAVCVGGAALVVKEYLPRGLVDRAKVFLRGTRAGLAWRAAQRLAACGIATPEPLAHVERGSSQFLITRRIEDGVALDRLLTDRFAGPLSREELAAKRQMLVQLGRWLRRIHDAAIYHNDWSPKNFLTAERPEGWRFYLLDLESVTFYKWLTPRRRRKNLSQLSDAPPGVTATDRMRVLLAYAGADVALTRGSFPRLVMRGTRRRSRQRAARSNVEARRPRPAPEGIQE